VITCIECEGYAVDRLRFNAVCQRQPYLSIDLFDPF